MLVATSEGVGGAVDGTSAETLLWSPERRRAGDAVQVAVARMLQPGGGARSWRRPARDHGARAARAHRARSTRAGRSTTTLEPARDPTGAPRPWDIEFGFVGGKLWLFQCRPFVGNDELKNVTALASLEGPVDKGTDDGVARGEAPMRARVALSCARARRDAGARRARGDRDRVGRERAAAGRLLPLVRAVLLHRLRAAHAGSRRACTSSSRAATRCA